MIEIKEKKTEEQEVVLNLVIRQKLIEALLMQLNAMGYYLIGTLNQSVEFSYISYLFLGLSGAYFGLSAFWFLNLKTR